MPDIPAPGRKTPEKIDGAPAYCTNPLHPVLPMEWCSVRAQWECETCGCVDDVTPAPDGRQQLTPDQKSLRSAAQARRVRGDDPDLGDAQLIANDAQPFDVPAKVPERLYVVMDTNGGVWRVEATPGAAKVTMAFFESQRNCLRVVEYVPASKVGEMNDELIKLRVLGPDTEARVECEARAIASKMLQPCIATWKKRVAELEADLAAVRAENERMKAIVDKLPVTRDGAAVVPLADYVYFESFAGGFGTPDYDLNGHIKTAAVLKAFGSVSVSECYSTREAAVAAHKGGGQ